MMDETKWDNIFGVFRKSGITVSKIIFFEGLIKKFSVRFSLDETD